MTSRYPEERLVYRRQFVIGPRFVDRLASWKRLRVGPFRVTVHPELPACHVADGDVSLLLLGYVLDPEHWQLADEPIVRSLLGEVGRGQLPSALARLGGRWVLVVDTPHETLVFHDAFGMRQVYYTEGPGDRWCAAQPGLLAATLGIPVDDRAVAALGHCSNNQFWLPGPRTIYGGVARLAPNHSLELRTGRVHRYWPDSPCVPRSLDEAVEVCCRVVQGLFRAAHARFGLAQTITAGWDSRLSLAASRAHAPDVFYLSMRYWDMTAEHPDLAVPGTLLPRLGLEHHVIDCPDAMEPAFERLYMRSAAPAHYAYGTIAQGMYERWPADLVCVKSNVAETIRRSYELPRSSSGMVKADAVLRKMALAPSAFMIESLEEWLAPLGSRLQGFDLSDVFYWEQRMGAWQAASQHEWDIVVETFDPLNCRRLMAHLMSVPQELRGPPGYLVHRTAIERMWPETLSEPINPHKAKKRASGLAGFRQLATGSRIYRAIRRRLAAALRGADGG